MRRFAPRLSWKRIGAVAYCVLVALASAQAACAQEAVPFRVCAEDPTWQRPTPEDMARTVWRDNRYVGRTANGVDLWPAMVPYYTQHFLLFTQASSGMSHAQDLIGLAQSHPGSICPPGDDLMEIWSLGYHVNSPSLSQDTLVLKVEPTSSGYELIHAPRPPQSTWTARFVLADGTEVAVASPVHELVATAIDVDQLDTGLPVSEEGRGVIDNVTRDATGRLTYACYVVLVPGNATAMDEATAYEAVLSAVGTPPIPGALTVSLNLQ